MRRTLTSSTHRLGLTASWRSRRLRRRFLLTEKDLESQLAGRTLSIEDVAKDGIIKQLESEKQMLAQKLAEMDESFLGLLDELKEIKHDTLEEIRRLEMKFTEFDVSQKHREQEMGEMSQEMDSLKDLKKDFARQKELFEKILVENQSLKQAQTDLRTEISGLHEQLLQKIQELGTELREQQTKQNAVPDVPLSAPVDASAQHPQEDQLTLGGGVFLESPGLFEHKTEPSHSPASESLASVESKDDFRPESLLSRWKEWWCKPVATIPVFKRE